MNLRSVFLAIYVSFLSFSMLSLFFGATGIASMEKLNDRSRAVGANLRHLESRQEDLKTTLSRLRSDPEAVTVEARSLGLYRPGENVAYLSGPDEVRERYDAGSVLRLDPIQRNEETFLRVSALAAGILVILVSLVSWRIRDAHSQR